MLTARILCPVRVLGPGRRIGLWMQGCNRLCEGCANPELRPFDAAREVPVSLLAEMLGGVARARDARALTVTGGEPFEQAADLAALLDLLAPDIADVLVFTGYTLDELRARRDPTTDAALALTDCLIDGPYVKALNNGSRLRGSDNQRIHILKDRNRALYHDHLAREGNGAQNFAAADGVIAVGIHRGDFDDRLRGL